ncbi:MAG TPA: hypothetical protein VIP11_23510 [Gemmatimonadaceae bacterium]
MSGGARYENWYRHDTDSGHFDRDPALDRKASTALPTQVLCQRRNGASLAPRIYYWPSVMKKISEEIRADVSIEPVVFELVLEASEAFVARDVAVASIKCLERSLKHLGCALTGEPGEARAARERIVQIDLSFVAILASIRESRPIVRLHFTGL